MKCKECNSCLRVVRLDFETYSVAYWYCYLCNTAFLLKNSFSEKETNIDMLKLLKEKYEKQYGKRL